MRILRGEEGAALVTALMLTMLALVISMALLYSVTTSTRISASQKRYRSALAAAHGGVDFFTQEIIPSLFQADPNTKSTLESRFDLISLKLPQYDCLQLKITSPTSEWASKCTAEEVSDDPGQSPDATFKLQGLHNEPAFTVSTKIIDTIPGNSDKSGIELDAGSSVSGRDEVIHPQHVPGLYSLSVQGARDGAAAREKARLSVLYAY